jgi:hypothetical protein
MTLDGSPLASNRITLDPRVSGAHEVYVQLGSEVVAVAHPDPGDPRSEPKRRTAP